MKNNKMTIGIYIRVSTDKQAQEGYSLDAQREEGTKEAYRLFGENIDIKYYVDEGISAKKIAGRKDLLRMMQDVENGHIQVVITYKVSRLSRSLHDSLKLADKITKANVRFISIKEGEYGTAHLNLQFNILASVAQYQREELAENVQLGMSQRAREGHWNGGIVLGYKNVEKKLVVVPEEAEIIQLIFDKYANQGWGTKKIANYLNQIGKRTKKGKHFSIVSVSTILDNPVYKGYIRFNQVIDWENKRRKGKNPDYILAKGIHEAIVDEDTWERAKALRKMRATGTPRQYSGKFPLTSLAKCPDCGSYMTSVYGAKRKNGTKARYYACGQYHNKGKTVCNPNLINADWLEKAVFERLKNVLSSDVMIEQITERINAQMKKHPNFTEQSKEMETFKKRLAELELRKKRIQEAFEMGSDLFTPEEAKERMDEIRTEISEAQNELFKLQQNETNNHTAMKPVSPEFIKNQLGEFLELADHLEPLEFRDLLVASIKKIEATKKELKNIHFSFIAHLPENAKNPLTDSALHTASKSQSLLLRGLYFTSNHYLFMIRFPLNNPKTPINLLN
ncbi:recombinase family protein [Metasolibacillus sp. FSL K6-0083]|uniref:recombinase family protein n=1 Tax=Metasolibacillus sp. FSL K6-0083 TaxID=2921416 RepID=UPI00315B1CA9